MSRLAKTAIGIVAAVATIAGVVVATGGTAEASPVCGVWTRATSTNPDNDGMQVRLAGDTAIVVDPAGSRFPYGSQLWRSVDESDGEGELEVRGSDGDYYAATFTRPDATTIQLTVGLGSAGSEQTWTTTSPLGCEDVTVSDVACGTWERATSDNPVNDGMRVRLTGDRAVVVDAAGGYYSFGDVLWRGITPDGGGATLEVRGSDGDYYAGTLLVLDTDDVRIELDSFSVVQTWTRTSEVGCDGDAPSDVACGVWVRTASTDPALDGTEVRISGDTAIVTSSPAGTWLHQGDVVWRGLGGTDEGAEVGLPLQVLGSDGNYHEAVVAVLGADELRLDIEFGASEIQQTWSRVNDVGCGVPAELVCGVWERSGSTNPRNDGMRIRLEGTTAVVTDAATSTFAVGDVLWRAIERVDDGLRLEVLGSDGDHYPASLIPEGVDGLSLTVELGSAGSEQRWGELDASGCVADLGPAGPVCGTWERTTSTNPANDGMTVVADGLRARVVDPAGSRHAVGTVLWRHIAEGDQQATFEFRGSDGDYYAATLTLRAPDELDVVVGLGTAGSEQTWVRTDWTGCDAGPVDDGDPDTGLGVDALCGTWERTASTNERFDGMRVVGAGNRALVTDAAGSTFDVGDLLWRDIRSVPPATTLDVRGTDDGFHPGELTATGLEELRLDIDASGAGAAQTWETVDGEGCDEAAPTDVVCGTWERVASTNPDLDGTTVQVVDGRGVVTSVPAGATGFAMGDVLWRDVVPAAAGWMLDVRGSDGAYHPARVLLDGVDTAFLSIDAGGRGTEQEWSLATPGSCELPQLATCGTWTREASTNPSLDGTLVRVSGTEATVVELPAGATGLAIGDVVWRDIDPAAPGGTSLEVRGSDGAYYPGTLTPLGLGRLQLVVDAEGAGAEQTWGEVDTQGCPPIRARLGGSATEPGPTPPSPEPDPTRTAAPEPAGCDLVGRWDLREQPFLDQVSALAAVPGGGFEATHRSGNYVVTLNADGSYTAIRDDWTFGFSTPQGGIVITINSDDSGTWSATDDQLTISEPAGEATVDFAIEQGGQLVPIPIAPPQSVGTEPISGTGSYVCRGDVLEVTFAGSGSPAGVTELREGQGGVTSTFDRVG